MSKTRTKYSSKKTENINSADFVLSKNRTWLDLINKEALLMNPGREEWRQRLANSLLMWAENSSSLEIMQFCIDFKITRSMLYEWANKYKEIGEALEHARHMIACHRRTGSMTKRLDGNYAYRDMHLYDSEWHAVNKYHADLKKEEEKASHTFIINTDRPKVVTKEEMKENVLKENDDQQSS